MTKATTGNFFEDFRVGRVLTHATPRTVTAGDVALHAGLTGSRFALPCADTFARACGLPGSPIDELLVFHIVFGKSVPDVSLNAVANLGYAECRWLAPVFPGDTLSATSEVIGLRPTSDGVAGIVHVRTTGTNQHGAAVLSFVRWVMVRKRDTAAAVQETVVPTLSQRVDPAGLVVPAGLDFRAYDPARAGSPWFLDDYAAGEVVDHVDGVTIEEAEHQIATRLYQNTARPHFDAVLQRAGRFGRRLVYGGHVISLARAASFNGLGNAALIAAINGGRHVAPSFAGDTIYARSHILEVAPHAERRDIGALRLRTIAYRKRATEADGRDETTAEGDEDTVLDLDYWVWMPRSL